VLARSSLTRARACARACACACACARARSPKQITSVSQYGTEPEIDRFVQTFDTFSLTRGALRDIDASTCILRTREQSCHRYDRYRDRIFDITILMSDISFSRLRFSVFTLWHFLYRFEPRSDRSIDLARECLSAESGSFVSIASGQIGILLD